MKQKTILGFLPSLSESVPRFRPQALVFLMTKGKPKGEMAESYCPLVGSNQPTVRLVSVKI